MTMETPNLPPPRGSAARGDLRSSRLVLGAILFIMSVGALSLAREFLVPVVLAILVALALSPVLRALRRAGVPSLLAAPALMLLAALVVGTLGYLLSGPVSQMVEDAPLIASQLSQRLAELRKPFDSILALSQDAGLVTQGTGGGGPQRVVVEHPPAFLATAAESLEAAASTLAITFVLALSLLASGSALYERIVEATEHAEHKARLRRVAVDVQREISRYLLTITLINLGLGAVISHGLWMIGLPNALLWGVMAALLNFMPYLGSLLTVAAVAVISLVTFDSLAHALLAPAFVVLCDVVEGQFLSPAVIGRRLEINAVAILLAVSFWTWLWGLAGALMAVPLLVLAKVFCDNFPELSLLSGLLSVRDGKSGPASVAAAAAGETTG